MEDYLVRVRQEIRPGRSIDGGALLAQTLVDLGVEVAFGVHGGHLDAALIGMHDRGIALVDTRHEAVAVNAADGYARVSGKLGVAFATAGAGLANAIAGLSTAALDRSPVLVITSSPPRREAETNPLQGGLDQVALSRPVSKWAHQIVVAEEIPRLVAHAARVALTGGPGPVVIDVPIDVLFGPVREDGISVGGGPTAAYPPAPAREGVARATELLRSAVRPVVVVGGGVRSPRARALLEEFATASGIPVFHQPYVPGTLSPQHPGFASSTKSLALLTAAGEGPDVALVLGSRFGKQLGGRKGSVIPFDAKVIQVDTDPVEIGRMRPVEVGLTADSGETLAALLDAVREEALPERKQWLDRATAVYRDATSPFESDASESGSGLHPFHAVRQIMHSLPEGANVVVDGGEVGGWVGGLLHEAKPRRGLGFGGYLGFLGIGPGLCIGAQVAEPESSVVLIVGDGSVGFNIQEFDTFVRHGLPVLVVVVNNCLWAMSSHGQNEVYGSSGEIISHLPDTDYHVVARGFGARGERVERLDDLASEIEKWAADPVPTCLNLMVSGDVVHPGTIAAVGNTDDPDVVVVPYYENVPDRSHIMSQYAQTISRTTASDVVAPTDDLAQAKRDLAEHGIALLTGVLTADESADIRRRLVEAADRSEQQGHPTRNYSFDPDERNRRVFMLFNHDPIFKDLIQHPVATEFVHQGLGENYLISNFSANITGPGAGRMALHADQQFAIPPWPDQPFGINVGWVLDDFTEEVGATRYVPGSHRFGHAPGSEVTTDDTIPVVAPAGSVMVMDGRLWHCTGANTTKDRERAALFGFYVLPWVRTQINWNIALDAEVAAGISDDFADRLGLRSGNSSVHMKFNPS